MSRVCVVTHLTLDGVMQAPGGADEDRRGGFEHGGWSRPYGDEVMGRVMGQGMATSGALLFGRRTYEQFASFWPHQPADAPFAGVLNDAQKYVASRTLAEPLPWQNSTLLAGDAADVVAALREEPGKDLVVLGSGELVRSLLARGLVDRFVLPIHPLVLGTGRRLFGHGDGGAFAALTLVDSVTTTTGVIIATYEPAR